MFVSLVALAILAVEGLSSVSNRELPAEFDALRLTRVAAAVNLLCPLGLGGKAPLEALAREGREIQFHLVEPRAALGRVGDLEAGGELLGHSGGQTVVEGAQGVGMEVVLHESNLLRLGVAGRQLLPELGVVAFGTLAADLLQALAAQRLDGGQYAATAGVRRGVGLLGGLPGFAGLYGLRGQALDDIAEQKTGPLVKAHDGKTRVIGRGVQGK